MATLEIERLKAMLDEANVPYVADYRLSSYMGNDGCQIIINNKNNERLCDAIQFYGSHGYENNLIEIMGGLTEEEEQEDTTLGWLSAEEVFKRFKYCYEHNTKYYVRED